MPFGREKIVDNLLSFIRPTPFHRSSVDIIQIIDQSIFILNQQIKKRKIRIIKEVPDWPLMFIYRWKPDSSSSHQSDSKFD